MATTHLRTDRPTPGFDPMSLVWIVFVTLLVVAGILAFWYLTVPYVF